MTHLATHLMKYWIMLIVGKCKLAITMDDDSFKGRDQQVSEHEMNLLCFQMLI